MLAIKFGSERNFYGFYFDLDSSQQYRFEWQLKRNISRGNQEYNISTRYEKSTSVIGILFHILSSDRYENAGVIFSLYVVMTE
jgi:hypothetical protein